MGRNLKIAIVHDDLIQGGGAEKVVAVMHNIFPQAPIYTSIYDKKSTLRDFDDADIRTSYLQNTPFGNKRFHKLALGAFPSAFEQFDLSDYDVVLSSSSRFAKGVITSPQTCHICYCYSPARFAWRLHDYLKQNIAIRILEPFLRSTFNDLRTWDAVSALRPDYYIAISNNTAERIRKYYRRDVAAVIYPPTETHRFQRASQEDLGDFYLCVSRFIGYKRVDLAIHACNKLGATLHIVGGGPEDAALKAIAGPTIKFLGRLSDKEVAIEYARCKAFIFPGEEDFGMTPIECMAAGRPVIGYAAGGALETIVDGKTGVFFSEQSVDSLLIAMEEFDQIEFFPDALESHARKFDVAEFESQLLSFIDAAIEDHRKIMSGKREKEMNTLVLPTFSNLH